jgi:hypothetical protein
MSYYDHAEWLRNQHKETKRRMEEKKEQWAKEQKNVILAEIKQLKGNPGDLSKVYTKKEISAVKKAELKQVKADLMAEQKKEIKEAKRDCDYAIKHYKSLITERKNEYNKTKKRLSKVDKNNLDFIMEELEEKWEKQWGKSQKNGTRKNK